MDTSSSGPVQLATPVNTVTHFQIPYNEGNFFIYGQVNNFLEGLQHLVTGQLIRQVK